MNDTDNWQWDANAISNNKASFGMCTTLRDLLRTISSQTIFQLIFYIWTLLNQAKCYQ